MVDVTDSLRKISNEAKKELEEDLLRRVAELRSICEENL